MAPILAEEAQAVRKAIEVLELPVTADELACCFHPMEASAAN